MNTFFDRSWSLTKNYISETSRLMKKCICETKHSFNFKDSKMSFRVELFKIYINGWSRGDNYGWLHHTPCISNATWDNLVLICLLFLTRGNFLINHSKSLAEYTAFNRLVFPSIFFFSGESKLFILLYQSYNCNNSGFLFRFLFRLSPFSLPLLSPLHILCLITD